MQTSELQAHITRAAAYIHNADGIIITAGAGMGVDSGLPDFRGDAGFWEAYPALAAGKISFADIANGQAFEDEPVRAWGFYGHRLQLYRDTIPHTGFSLLRDMALHKPHGAFVYTSNVDGQFHKAGFPANRVVECHGSIHRLQCTAACSSALWSAASLEVKVDMAKCALESPLPRCPHCNKVSRPNILMFNDWSWIAQYTDSQQAQFDQWRQQVKRPVVIELGAGTAIPTVRRRGEACNAPLIRINPTEPAVKNAQSVSLQVGALLGLQLLSAALK